MAQWSSGLLPAPLNAAQGFKQLEQAVNSAARYDTFTGERGVVDPSYPVGHIQRYGARCTGTYDDTSAFLYARDALTTSTVRGVLRLPNLPTKVTQSIALTATAGLSTPLGIRGEGQGSQVINACPTGNPTFLLSGSSFWDVGDFLMTGNSTNPNDGIVIQLNGGMPNQAARWRVERVVSMVAGRGFVVADTNTGVIRDCKHWPSSNTAAPWITPVVNASDISHAVHLTGTGVNGFCNDVAIYDLDAQPVSTYATGYASIKGDAANMSGIRVVSGLAEAGGGASADKHAIDLANVYGGLFIVGMYAENSNIKLSNCRDGQIVAMDGAGSGTVLITGSSSRITVQGYTTQNLQIDAGCTRIRIRDSEFFGTITDNGTQTRFDNVTNGGSPVADRGNHPITFRAKLSAGTSIAAGADTLVVCDSFSGGWDDYGTYSTTTGKFTPGVPGKYRISVTGNWSNVTANAPMYCNVKVNGALVDTGWSSGATGGGCGFFAATIVNLTAATDYVTISAQNGDSASRTLQNAAFMAEAL